MASDLLNQLSVNTDLERRLLPKVLGRPSHLPRELEHGPDRGIVGRPYGYTAEAIEAVLLDISRHLAANRQYLGTTEASEVPGSRGKSSLSRPSPPPEFPMEI